MHYADRGDYFRIKLIGFQESSNFDVMMKQYDIIRIPKKRYFELLQDVASLEEYHEILKSLGATLTLKERLNLIQNNHHF